MAKPLRELASGDKNPADQAGRVDIVAVHGLNPWNGQEHALDTWRRPSGPKGHLWLRDALPNVIPNARIFLYEYESSPAFGSTKERFVHQANDLLETIRIERRQTPRKPLLLIGHSLGGILIKQALVNAHNNPKYKLIQSSTRGLVFFGTPHGGGKETLVSLGSACARIVTAVSTNPSNDIMEVLRSGSLFSDILQESWRHQLSSYKIISFYEGLGEIVPRSSAVLGLPGDVENQVKINADHSDMCRFDLSLTKDQDNYRLVQANIEDLCDLDITTQGLQEWDREELRLVFKEINETTQKQMILESLLYSEIYDRYDKIAEAHEKTFEWAFKNPGPGFVTWLQEGEGIYWIRGKPGSGKSTLMKFLVNDQRTVAHFRNGASSSKYAMASFYFHDRGTPLQKSMVGLLRAILHQLLCQYDDLVMKVLPMYGKSRSLGVDRLWSREEELLQALTAIVIQQEVHADACLFIDGLDEYDGDHSAFMTWIKLLTDPSTKAGLRLKLCVSSRQLLLFEDTLGGYPGFVIHEMTRPDILGYVQSRLNAQLAMQNFQERDMGEILAKEIVEKASGVFVWVKLVVDELCYGLMEGDSAQELSQKITSVPDNLEDLYMSSLRKVRPRHREETRTLFEVVLKVQGPVTLLDLAMISAPFRSLKQEKSPTAQDADVQEFCHKMKRRLASRCGGLIEIQETQAEGLDQSLQKRSHVYDHVGNLGVQIVHQTAKELLRKPEIWESVGLPRNGVNINSILLRIFLQHYQRRLLHVNPFGTATWGLKKALECVKDLEETKGEASTDIVDKVREALDVYETFQDFVPDDENCSEYYQYYLRTSSFLCHVVSADLILYMSSKVAQGELDLSGPSSPEYLKATLSPYGIPAFASISLSMIRLLLGNGVRPNSDIPFQGLSAWQMLLLRPSLGPNPFLSDKEAFPHWLALCHLFLDYGANPRVEVPIGTPFTVEKTRHSRKTSDLGYTFPLHLVLALARGTSSEGLSALVEHLLRRGAEANKKDSDGNNAISVASRSFEGAEAVVRGYSSLRWRFRMSLGIASPKIRSLSSSPSTSER